MSANSVFVSYSRRDLDRDWLIAFTRALQDINVNVWVDEWNSPSGDRWAEELGRGLFSSDAIVAILSRDALESANVSFELGAALGADKRLILVVDPSSSTSLPLNLRQRRWIALQEPFETAREVARAISAPD
jgi:TIR domain